MEQKLIQYFNVELLREIDKADDLKIAPFRSDGLTYGTPTWVWSVVVEDNLYVRAYNGKRSRWYQSAVSQKSGRIYVMGMAIEVSFEIVPGQEINLSISKAYRDKYKNSPYLPLMMSKQTCDATIKILPKTQDGLTQNK